MCILHWHDRNTADDALATQIEVFEVAQLEDTAHIEMPGMVDINSHEDMFRAVLDKASCI